MSFLKLDLRTNRLEHPNYCFLSSADPELDAL